MMKEIFSNQDFNDLISTNQKSYILLYKNDSDSCQCALKNLEDISVIDAENHNVFILDVKKITDVHSKYGITSVPTLMHFENKELKNVVKGCMTAEYYNSYLNEKYSVISTKNDEVAQKRVIVYSTPSCPWCVKLKDYLKEKNIRFEDVDVAANSSRAEEMKKKSGQMGVPQTDIAGQMIVGFDKMKINRLLNIN